MRAEVGAVIARKERPGWRTGFPSWYVPGAGHLVGGVDGGGTLDIGCGRALRSDCGRYRGDGADGYPHPATEEGSSVCGTATLTGERTLQPPTERKCGTLPPNPQTMMGQPTGLAQRRSQNPSPPRPAPLLPQSPSSHKPRRKTTNRQTVNNLVAIYTQTTIKAVLAVTLGFYQLP